LGAIGALTDSESEEATREYFIELGAIVRDAKATASQRLQDSQEALASVESREQDNAVWFALAEDLLAVSRSSFARLKELSPPETVADQHAAFVDAYAAELRTMQRLIDEYEPLGFRRFLARFEEDFQELSKVTREACADLQAVAVEVNVDLGC
jgi:hypothetical protein